MQIEQLTQEFERAKLTDSVAVMLDFKNRLMAGTTDDVIAFHFGLLRIKSNQKLYQILRAAFVERGPAAEAFLLRELKTKLSTEMRNDAVQILGAMGSKEVAPIARNLISDEDADSRYRGCIVLGWVGTETDIGLLSNMLESDADPSLRAYAATALRQLWLRHPNSKDRILQILAKALQSEAEIEVIQLIIVALQTMLRKNFGLRENIRENTLTGDVAKAKVKATNYLTAGNN